MHTYTVVEKGQPVEKASKALILLHGRGSTAENILSLSDKLCDDSHYIAAPQATNNSWYPYRFIEDDTLNEPWLSSAIDIVKKLIDNTSKHIPKNQIFLAGFSQGACLTLEVAARYAAKYGGVAAFTGGLIGKNIDETKYIGNFDGTKVFIGLSENDPHIPLIRAKESKNVMEKLGAQVTLKVYPGSSHTINEDEINHVRNSIFLV